MNGYIKILEYVKNNNGYITTKEAEDLGVHKNFLSNLVNDKKMERVGVGVYKLPKYPLDNFYILSKCSTLDSNLFEFVIGDRYGLSKVVAGKAF